MHDVLQIVENGCTKWRSFICVELQLTDWIRFETKTTEFSFLIWTKLIPHVPACDRRMPLKFRRVSVCPIPYAHSITQSRSLVHRVRSKYFMRPPTDCSLWLAIQLNRGRKNETRLMKIKCLDTVEAKWHRLINCFQFGLILDLMVASLRLNVLNFRKTLKIRTNDSRMNSN